MIQKLLDLIIKNILNSQSVNILQPETENNTYIIQGTGDETGKIIGKGGSIVKAIRNIVSITTVKRSINQKPYIKIVE